MSQVQKKFGGPDGKRKYRDAWGKWVKGLFDTERPMGNDAALSEAVLESEELAQTLKKGWDMLTARK